MKLLQLVKSPFQGLNRLEEKLEQQYEVMERLKLEAFPKTEEGKLRKNQFLIENLKKLDEVENKVWRDENGYTQESEVINETMYDYLYQTITQRKKLDFELLVNLSLIIQETYKQNTENKEPFVRKSETIYEENQGNVRANTALKYRELIIRFDKMNEENNEIKKAIKLHRLFDKDIRHTDLYNSNSVSRYVVNYYLMSKGYSPILMSTVNKQNDLFDAGYNSETFFKKDFLYYSLGLVEWNKRQYLKIIKEQDAKEE